MKAFLEGPVLPINQVEIYGDLAGPVEQVNEYNADHFPTTEAERELHAAQRANACAAITNINNTVAADSTRPQALLAYARILDSVTIRPALSESRIARTRHMFTRLAMVSEPRLARSAFASAASEYTRQLVDDSNYTLPINEIDDATALLDTTVLSEQDRVAYGDLQTYKALVIARSGNADSALALALSVQECNDRLEIIEIAARASRFDAVDELLGTTLNSAGQYAQDPEAIHKNKFLELLGETARIARQLDSPDLNDIFSEKITEALNTNTINTEEYCRVVLQDHVQSSEIRTLMDHLFTTKGLTIDNQRQLWHAVYLLDARGEMTPEEKIAFVEQARIVAGSSPFAAFYGILLSNTEPSTMTKKAASAHFALPESLQDNKWLWGVVIPELLARNGR